MVSTGDVDLDLEWILFTITIQIFVSSIVVLG